MGIRTGAQFLDKINAMRPHIVIDGEVVSENVAEHPAFRDVAVLTRNCLTCSMIRVTRIS